MSAIIPLESDVLQTMQDRNMTYVQAYHYLVTQERKRRIEFDQAITQNVAASLQLRARKGWVRQTVRVNHAG